MSNFLDQLPPRIRAIAERINIRTPEEILNTPKTKFLDQLNDGTASSTLVKNCTANDVRVLKEAAAKLVAVDDPMPVLSIMKSSKHQHWSRISYACAALDRCTGGGIVTRGITEICGCSAAGKTQILLQLSLSVQLPIALGGLGKGVAYICTEDVFPSRRLLEISKTFEQRYPEHNINYLGNIYIEHLYEAEDLLNCVTQRMAKLMETVSIGLIIIDSVAAIFRLYTNFIERARDMRKMVNSLLSYAHKYNCAVICVNQMTAKLNKLPEVPCLGLSWAHLGRTRICISKIPKQLKLHEKLLTVRKLEILYSPETPNEFAEFLITGAGIVDVPDQNSKN